ncbi:hypothetical protein MSPP1_002112 [Malassezia sp. CBS 17886]|nr:hypothetical protein MSPP1_002112 [Malassezia sp. CBS 17886]
MDKTRARVDPHRLAVYQHQLNEKLTHENELLKEQCDALLHIIRSHNLPLDTDESSTAESARSMRSARAREDSEEVPLLQERVRVLEHTVEAQREEIRTARGSMPTGVGDGRRTSQGARYDHTRALHPVDVSIASRSLLSDDADAVASELHSLQDTVRALTAELHGVRTEMDAARARAEDMQQNRRRVEEQLAAADARLRDAETDAVEKTEVMRQAREQYLDTSHSSEAHREGELARLRAALSAAQAQASAAHLRHAQLVQQQAQLEAHLQTTTERAERATAAADAARAAQRACEGDMDRHIGQMEAMRAALADALSEKDHLSDERVQIMEQLHMFEQHLRQVRMETEQYGADLHALRNEKREWLAREAQELATRGVAEQQRAAPEPTGPGRDRHEAAARTPHDLDALVATALDAVRPALQLLQAQRARDAGRVRALLFQKAYLTRTLAAQEWLYGRLCGYLHGLSPVFAHGASRPLRPRVSRFRAAAAAVRFVLRAQRAASSVE